MLSHVVFIVCSVMLFFSENFSPLVGFFSSVFFPWWMLGIILLNAVPFLLAPPALVCVVCSMISNDDVFVWRAQQAPYHILSMVHGMLVYSHRQVQRFIH